MRRDANFQVMASRIQQCGLALKSGERPRLVSPNADWAADHEAK
jgi:hypothetical protein